MVKWWFQWVINRKFSYFFYRLKEQHLRGSGCCLWRLQSFKPGRLLSLHESRNWMQLWCFGCLPFMLFLWYCISIAVFLGSKRIESWIADDKCIVILIPSSCRMMNLTDELTAAKLKHMQVIFFFFFFKKQYRKWVGMTNLFLNGRISNVTFAILEYQ